MPNLSLDLDQVGGGAESKRREASDSFDADPPFSLDAARRPRADSSPRIACSEPPCTPRRRLADAIAMDAQFTKYEGVPSGGGSGGDDPEPEPSGPTSEKVVHRSGKKIGADYCLVSVLFTPPDVLHFVVYVPQRSVRFDIKCVHPDLEGTDKPKRKYVAQQMVKNLYFSDDGESLAFSRIR